MMTHGPANVRFKLHFWIHKVLYSFYRALTPYPLFSPLTFSLDSFLIICFALPYYCCYTIITTSFISIFTVCSFQSDAIHHLLYLLIFFIYRVFHFIIYSLFHFIISLQHGSNHCFSRHMQASWEMKLLYCGTLCFVVVHFLDIVPATESYVVPLCWILICADTEIMFRNKHYIQLLKYWHCV